MRRRYASAPRRACMANKENGERNQQVSWVVGNVMEAALFWFSRV